MAHTPINHVDRRSVKCILFLVFRYTYPKTKPHSRVSSETSFVSKQPKLGPKLVSALSETRRLFRVFRFNIETGSFGVWNNRNKQTTNQNSSKFVKTKTSLIPHTISSVCFGCFDTGLKQRNKPKQTEKKFCVSRKNKPKQIEFQFELRKKINCFKDPLIENVFWRFFRFVSAKFCLFPLFLYRSETPKQTEMFFGFEKQTKKQPKQIEFQFVSVRTGK
jgi:hypothetical protein